MGGGTSNEGGCEGRSWVWCDYCDCNWDDGGEEGDCGTETAAGREVVSWLLVAECG